MGGCWFVKLVDEDYLRDMISVTDCNENLG